MNQDNARARPNKAPQSAVAAVIATSRSAFVSVGAMSGVINILMLTGSLFMMQVYDRVLASRSVATLVALSLIAIGAYAFQGLLDAMRGRILALIGERIDDEVGPRVHDAVVELPLLKPRAPGEALQPFRDIEMIRSFFAGAGPLALFDLPWVPIYLVVLYLLHPLLCFVTVGGALVLIVVTVMTEVKGKAPTRSANEALSARNALVEGAQRNAEAIRAMGMYPVLARNWQEAHTAVMSANRRLLYTVGKFSVFAKTFRMILQSGVLGLGAYLAINGELSGGAIIAATILSSRALAPIDMTIASWRGFLAARQGHTRLQRFLSMMPEKLKLLDLPAPSRTLVVEHAVIAAPGTRQPIVKRVSFGLTAGQGVGVIGPTASGKTTLARALVGVWSPMAGRVMIDGASLEQWDPVRLGPSIGYLPQDVQLFDGTIAENIARFEWQAESQAIIAAAAVTGFHETVLSLPQGYNTRIGQGGIELSGGQRQRIGLARALYRDPFLVVLDEPNANLDADGEAALTQAIKSVRQRGGIVVVVAHRPSAIEALDQLLVMKAGEIVAFGPKDEVLAKTTRAASNVFPLPAVRVQAMAQARVDVGNGGNDA